mmetsp:Transcript_17048/g.37067  ORF Transcript_17048/g.37067 Transcript_17048/m.37067 type:complete len:162 (-) Transcript_17048:4-489(-)
MEFTAETPAPIPSGASVGAAAGGVGGTGRTRTPGTKLCPQCHSMIAAARAKCPHCSFVFRERKVKPPRSGKRGKKLCPKCGFENPAATSRCKSCHYVFRLKIQERFKRSALTVPSKHGVLTAAQMTAAAPQTVETKAVGPAVVQGHHAAENGIFMPQTFQM